MSDQARILVVDDSATQLLQIRLLLEAAGFSVCAASDGEEALEHVQSEVFSLVVTDLQMPRMDGLELVREIARQELNVPVILTTAAGSEMVAAEALHAGAASYVPKSGLATMLLPTVERILELKQAAEPDPHLAECLESMTFQWSLTNHQSLVPNLIRRIESILHEMGLSDPAQLLQVAMALDEATNNAMVHGNLEVSSELRRTDDGRPFLEKIDQRLNEAPYRDRRVLFNLNVTKQKATFTIRDEGPGFKVSDVADPTDPANLEKEGGRGLLLINTFMDEVKHNASGSEIVMVKHCHRE